ncbi:MAG: hypothetical protein MK538_20245, partial [Planctomycetes bacterium]|nr:hypothetical protein [Planctomycetota bacterium]
MIRRTALIIVSIFTFVLSLQMIQAGALPTAEILRPSNGPVACLGLGWLLACLVLSGSPVAATSLAFLASDILNVHESFAMIIGSRLGASFVVLAIGLIYQTRSDGQGGGVYVGVLAFLITATVYLPAMALGYICINTGWLDAIHVPGSFPLVSVIDQIFSPIVDLVIAGCDAASLPKWTLSVAGIGVMVFAFKLFDLTLPTGDPLGGRIGQMSRMIFRPSVAFLVGMLLTC